MTLIIPFSHLTTLHTNHKNSSTIWIFHVMCFHLHIYFIFLLIYSSMRSTLHTLFSLFFGKVHIFEREMISIWNYYWINKYSKYLKLNYTYDFHPNKSIIYIWDIIFLTQKKLWALSLSFNNIMDLLSYFDSEILFFSFRITCELFLFFFS